MTPVRVLTLVFMLVLAACGASSAEPPVTFPTVGPTWVAHPPTPDPPVDPAVLEPQVLRSPVVLTEIDIVAAGNGRVDFTVNGNLPSPCHSLHTVLGADGAIHLSLWAEVPVEEVCATVEQPFERILALDGLEAGTYPVLLDGKQISTVELPLALSAAGA